MNNETAILDGSFNYTELNTTPNRSSINKQSLTTPYLGTGCYILELTTPSLYVKRDPYVVKNDSNA